jgi:hypothetical protein
LDDKNVLIAHDLINHDVDFAVREQRRRRFTEPDFQNVSNALGQSGMR